MLSTKSSRVGVVLAASFVLTLSLILGLHNSSPMRVATAAGLIDNSLSDFALGSGNCFVGQSYSPAVEDGEVILSPTVGTNFSGNALPFDWYVNTGGIVTVTNGVVVVANSTIYPGPVPLPALLYSPTRTLEFSATFVPGGGRQFAGFGTQIFDTAGPWAIFSSVDGATLQARTNNNTVDITSPSIVGTFLGVSHHYRIDWGLSEVIYSIDGTPVVTHAVTFGSVQMRPQFHDGDPFPFEGGGDGGSLLVDWARMSDYAPSPCTYTSHLFDSGLDGSTYTGLSTTLSTPAGTSIGFEVITSTDNLNWGTWTAVNADGTFSVGAARYLRYRAALSTSDPQVTPQLQRVQLHGFGPPPTAVRVTALSAEAATESHGWLIGLSGAVCLVLGAWVTRHRKALN